MNGSYLITWDIIPNANYYLLEEDTNISFTSPIVKYIGIETSILITSEPNNTYYYRLRGWNQAGYGDWSIIKEAYIPPDVIPPTPNDNTWSLWIVVAMGLGITVITLTAITLKRKKMKSVGNRDKEEEA